MAVEQPRSTTAELVLNDVKLQLRRQVLQTPQAPFTTQQSTLRGPNVDPPKDGFKAEVKVELGKDGKPLKQTAAEKSLNAKNAAEFQKLFDGTEAPKDVQAQLKDLKWGVDNIKDPKKLVEFVKEAVAEGQAQEATPAALPEGTTKADERPSAREGKLLKGAKDAERGEQRRLLQKDEVTRTNVKASDLLRTAGHTNDPKKLSEAAQQRFTFAPEKGQPATGKGLTKSAFAGQTQGQGTRGGAAVSQGAKVSPSQQALQRQLKAIKDPEKFARFAEKAMGLDQGVVPQGTVLSKELQRELLRQEVKQEKKEQRLMKTPHPLDVPFGGKDGSLLTPTQFFAAALNVYSQNPPRFRAYMAAFFAQHFANYGQGIASVSQGGSQNATKGQTGGSFKQGQSGSGRGR